MSAERRKTLLENPSNDGGDLFLKAVATNRTEKG